MKLILGSMLALAIAGSPLLAKQEPDEKEKPKQEETKKPAEKPKDKPDKAAKPEKAEKPADKPTKQEPDAKPQPKVDKAQQKQDEKQQKAEQKNNRDETRTDNRGGGREATQQTQTQSGGGGGQHGRGQRIPDDKFRSSFGREHHFHVSAHRGDRNFSYGGYTFEVVEGWPAGWVFDDECYIELVGDDYYLVDVVHPELRVLVVIG